MSSFERELVAWWSKGRASDLKQFLCDLCRRLYAKLMLKAGVNVERVFYKSKHRQRNYQRFSCVPYS